MWKLNFYFWENFPKSILSLQYQCLPSGIMSGIINMCCTPLAWLQSKARSQERVILWTLHHFLPEWLTPLLEVLSLQSLPILSVLHTVSSPWRPLCWRSPVASYCQQNKVHTTLPGNQVHLHMWPPVTWLCPVFLPTSSSYTDWCWWLPKSYVSKSWGKYMYNKVHHNQLDSVRK